MRRQLGPVRPPPGFLTRASVAGLAAPVGQRDLAGAYLTDVLIDAREHDRRSATCSWPASSTRGRRPGGGGLSCRSAGSRGCGAGESCAPAPRAGAGAAAATPPRPCLPLTTSSATSPHTVPTRSESPRSPSTPIGEGNVCCRAIKDVLSQSDRLGRTSVNAAASCSCLQRRTRPRRASCPPDTVQFAGPTTTRAGGDEAPGRGRGRRPQRGAQSAGRPGTGVLVLPTEGSSTPRSANA